MVNFPDVNYWKSDAQDRLQKKLLAKPIEGIAKNVIFNLGDGMSGKKISILTNQNLFKIFLILDSETQLNFEF